MQDTASKAVVKTGAGKAGRAWSRRIAVVLLGACAAIACGEIAVRAWAAWKYPRTRSYHPTLGWALNPNVERVFANEYGESCRFVTNEWGQRSQRSVPLAASTGYRVLFLGDSFTEAIQVDADQVFTRVVELALPDVEVINAGVACYGTVQELLYLRGDGMAFEPQLVVLMLCLNDLTDNIQPWFLGMGARPYARLDGGGVVVIEPCSLDRYLPFCLPVPFGGFFLRHSFLYRSLNQKVWQPAYAEQLIAMDRQMQPAVPRTQRMEILAQLLGKMRALVENGGKLLAVALIPTRRQVRGQKQDLYAGVLRACRACGVRTVSLLEAMRAARTQGLRPYYEHDTHWTKDGHHVAASELIGLIQEVRG